MADAFITRRGGALSTVKSRLPEGYTELEYIQSSGTQYIDTGFKPNQDTRVVMDLQLTAADKTQYAFGCRSSEGGAAPYFGLLFRPASTGVRSDYGSTQQTFSQTATTNRITIDRNKNITAIGSETVTHTAETFSVDYTLQLFGTNDGGVYTWFLSGKFFSCQIYDNGALIRDYVPCQVVTGDIGLYELVEGKFYSNAGTGVFTSVLNGETIQGVEKEPTVQWEIATVGNTASNYLYFTLPKLSHASGAQIDGSTSSYNLIGFYDKNARTYESTSFSSSVKSNAMVYNGGTVHCTRNTSNFYTFRYFRALGVYIESEGVLS